MPRPRRTEDEGFNRFWRAYPKHVAKLDALKAWNALKPTPEMLTAMLEALEWQRHQPAWLKDRGAFIPYPATWLRAGRWLDEQTVAVPSAAAKPYVPPAYRPYISLAERDRMNRERNGDA